ncbi:hypothetical protein ACFL0M_10595 [Thermodesulfobacteriota bacterium]
MSEKDARARTMQADAFKFIERNKREVTKIGEALFYFAELGMQEFKTSDWTADVLSKDSFLYIKSI